MSKSHTILLCPLMKGVVLGIELPMIDVLYNKIGRNYSVGRKTDPIIASSIWKYLEGARSILNIGAGTGSYEPTDVNLIAVEPSREMITQRPVGAHEVRQASAESLPFGDAVFTDAMTVLSMHHWKDRKVAFEEIKRVVTRRFVAVTWNPESEMYWLTKDYFPEVHEIDKVIFPDLGELESSFEGIRFYSLPIPSNCIDGFTAAYWARPRAYLDPVIRSGMSTFSKIAHLETGLKKLQHDLDSGVWDSKYGSELRCRNSLDVGYVVAVWDKDKH
jgi:SAM-dependent methyltransferase